jgi:hypothetical protein
MRPGRSTDRRAPNEEHDDYYQSSQRTKGAHRLRYDGGVHCCHTGGDNQSRAAAADDFGHSFSQRFTGTFSVDANTITGVVEKSSDSVHWEHDFDLTFTKGE